MRIWSLHPKYLDSKGLVAVWREALLAKDVLLGFTKGYKNHPQLSRFKKLKDPILGINTYLNSIYLESLKRGYIFDESKIDNVSMDIKIKLTKGQLQYEFKHLLNKLKARDRERYDKFKKEKKIEENPVFFLVEGEIEEWEKS